MPNPRLTDLGCGLFCGLAMFVLAGIDRLLFGASTALYGVLFLLVSALTAVWVRRGDLASAPVVVPIAFAAGQPLLAEGEGGLGGHLLALVTALAMQAGWLYGGTLVAGVIVTVRKVRLMARRAAERERQRGRDRHGREVRGSRDVRGRAAAGVRPRASYGRGPAGPRAPRPSAQPHGSVSRGR
jgi:membrane protein implicated in regulation of membrane protease activity